MAFRIGVHLGNVLVEDGDLYGDGVNIAARLEGIAQRGGIPLIAFALALMPRAAGTRICAGSGAPAARRAPAKRAFRRLPVGGEQA